MSLATLIEADVDAVFLNTDDFAAAGTYYPETGEPREVVAVHEVEGAPVDEGKAHQTRVESLTVHAKESDTTGIRDPLLGAAWLLPGEDPETDKWDFAEVLSRAGGMITCRFTRTKIDTQGELTPDDL
jgi:hypothetical protein